MSARMIASALLVLAASSASASADEAPETSVPAPAPASAPAIAVEIAPMPPSAPAVAGPPAPRLGPRLKAVLDQHVAAGRQPTVCVLADDGRTLVVTNRGDNTVSVFSTDDMSLQKTIVEVGYSAWGAAVLPSQILVANWAGSSIALLDRESGKRTGELPVGMKPSYLALSPDGRRVYSAGNFSDDVTLADVSGKRPPRSVNVGRRPMGIALSKDGSTLWVAVCDSKKISKVDVRSESVTDTFGAPLAATTNLVLTPDGRHLLAAGDNGRLLVMDTATGDVEKIGVGSDSSSVAVTPDGRVALVTDYEGGTVSLVDVPGRVKYAWVAVGAGPIHVETDGRRFYTCNDKAGSVSVFRLEPEEPAAAPVP